MEGRKYPLDLHEAEQAARELVKRCGEIEMPIAQEFDRYPQLHELAATYGLQALSDVMGYVTTIGDRYGVPEHLRERCTHASIKLGNILSDLDLMYLHHGGSKWLGLENGEVYSSAPKEEIVKLHFLRPVTILGQAIRKEGRPEADIVGDVKRCVAYWTENVSDVLLTSVPQEAAPEAAVFDALIEKVYEKNVRENPASFWLCHSRAGREATARLAGIGAGDSVIDIGSGSGWMLPHIGRYKPGKIYAAEVVEDYGLEDMLKMMKHRSGPVERVRDFYAFKEPVDIAICSQANFFGRALLPRMCEAARKGIVVGGQPADPASQYARRNAEPDATNVKFEGRQKAASYTNGEMRRMEREAAEHFKNVRVSQYDGWLILSASEKKH